MTHQEHDKASRTTRLARWAGAVLLACGGAFLLIAVSYAPDALGLQDDASVWLMLLLRGLGFALLIGAGALIFQPRQKE